MNLQDVFCPNLECRDRYKAGKGNIVSHGKKRVRYKCKTCQRTFSGRHGTMFYGLRSPEEEIVQVVTLVANGCPQSAIVKAFGRDERTVASWVQRAGDHAELFHHQQMRQLDLKQVQVDEIRLKVQDLIVWVAMAIAVGSRLWLGAVCREKRDKHMAEQIMTCIYNWAQRLPLVLSFDGWNAYPTAARNLFREALYTGKPGAPRKLVWQELILVQVVKKSSHTAGIVRWILDGSCLQLQHLIQQTQGAGTINTAYIERLNATFRARLAFATRRTRHLARKVDTVNAGIYLVGCLYNFCDLHDSLDNRTPAMVARLTDRQWSVYEVLSYRPQPFWLFTT